MKILRTSLLALASYRILPAAVVGFEDLYGPKNCLTYPLCSDRDMNDAQVKIGGATFHLLEPWAFDGYVFPIAETPFPNGWYFDYATATGELLTATALPSQSGYTNTITILDVVTLRHISLSEGELGIEKWLQTKKGDPLLFWVTTDLGTSYGSTPSQAADGLYHAVVTSLDPPVIDTSTTLPTPEPGTWVLMLAGIGLIIVGRKGKKHA